IGFGKEPPRTGNRHSGLVYAPYNTYPASDGFIAIFCAKDEHWRGLTRVLGLPELADDERFATIGARSERMDEVDEIVRRWTTNLSRDDAFRQLMAKRVPASPLLRLSEVLHDPHFRQRGSIVPLDHPTAGRLFVNGSPLHLSESRAKTPSLAPELGQHTDSVLAELLDLDPEQIRIMRSRGAVGAAT
ncbi:MAG: CoA transferase, partial [Amphiplicatus sp.]